MKNLKQILIHLEKKVDEDDDLLESQVSVENQHLIHLHLWFGHIKTKMMMMHNINKHIQNLDLQFLW